MSLYAPSQVGNRAFEEWWGADAALGRQSRDGASADGDDLPRPICARSCRRSACRRSSRTRPRTSYIPIELGREVASLIPGARFIEYPGGTPTAGSSRSDSTTSRSSSPAAVSPSRGDRVLATVMFTDIVGSTEHASRLGDGRWRELLDEHNSVVRTALERWRGTEVKTIGDGFLATFDGPARAVHCASEIVDGVTPLGLNVRTGLHTGECELVGDDVAGMAVHIGARVMAQAQAGEVLASSTVKDLVVGSGLRFEDRGSHELKGVPDEWRLYALAR